MASVSMDTFKARRTMEIGNRTFSYVSLEAAEAGGVGPVSRLPRSLRVILENLLRFEDGKTVTAEDIRAVAASGSGATADRDIAFRPARVLMPESSGIPLLADLAAMRDATVKLGGDPEAINPVVPVDVIVDHSVMVDVAGSAGAFGRNMELEFERNAERYAFLRWGQKAFRNLRVLPPGSGICHQINLEYLSRVVCGDEQGGDGVLYPDTVLGMDSHTPMINSLGIIGWGVGGIEAGSAMLGQPVAMRVPEVLGCRLVGRARDGVTTTDVVLTVTQILRSRDLVGKFVEFFGDGAAALPAAERGTLSNMAPEYGATVGYFAIDDETIRYLAMTGRDPAHLAVVEAYARAQGLWRDGKEAGLAYADVVEIDLSQVEPSVAGPKLPHGRRPLSDTAGALATEFPKIDMDTSRRHAVAGHEFDLGHGDVVLAAITSCTNTSNPAVMIAAGLLARNAVALGLRSKPWVKTSLAPGSRVVAGYLEATGLQAPLDTLGFQVIGYGCTTCMGNSGPLDDAVSRTIVDEDLVTCAVLSGNRNFEGRVHQLIRANFLASPPLVVAFALAGTVDIDLANDPLGTSADGTPVRLRDIWPSAGEVADVLSGALSPDLYLSRYQDIEVGPPRWRRITAEASTTYPWDDESTYIRRPPHFDGMDLALPEIGDITGARPLLVLGDAVTTDHISPIGTIPEDTPSGRYLSGLGIEKRDFNNYAARRVNHDVAIRGTFANVRLRNEMVGDRTGGYTRHMPDGEEMAVYDAAVRYRDDGVPLVVVAGTLYGAGSSRDWAAKGTRHLGIRAVIAESFERIHRSNLIGMGVLPLQFPEGTNRGTLAIDGSETFDVTGLSGELRPGMAVRCRIGRADGSSEDIDLTCRLDTAFEVECYRNGGILHYVLRSRIADAA
jgi:aconitate hydratase